MDGETTDNRETATAANWSELSLKNKQTTKCYIRLHSKREVKKGRFNIWFAIFETPKDVGKNPATFTASLFTH